MTRFIKRGGKIWVRVFPTSRSRRSRRKRGWAKARARPKVGVRRAAGPDSLRDGRRDAAEAREAFQLAASKLPILTKFATRFAEEKVS
jgi:large subunit ribosomal protein L16